MVPTFSLSLVVIGALAAFGLQAHLVEVRTSVKQKHRLLDTGNLKSNDGDLFQAYQFWAYVPRLRHVPCQALRLFQLTIGSIDELITSLEPATPLWSKL
jgi:hypothetical protein